MRITELLCPGIKGHKYIDFIDVDTNSDSRLFIDPYLIAVSDDLWCKNSQSCIESFFKALCNIHRNKLPYSAKRCFFNHCHEVNATKTGYGNGSNGKAKTADGMILIFSQLTQFMDKKIPISQIRDLPLLLDGFDKDCLSDLLTNVLFKNLMDFTIRQCEKYQYPLSDAPAGYFYWDPDKENWQEYRGKCLLIDGELILLLPKKIMRQRYYFGVENYFNQIIIPFLQEEDSIVDNTGKIYRPSKKETRKKHIENSSVRQFTLDQTVKHPEFLDAYHNFLPRNYKYKALDDSELDEIIYGII